MKSIKYILTGFAFIVGVSIYAQKTNGLVTIVDEPVKGAKVYDANEKLLATTNEEGLFSSSESVSKVVVTFKNLKAISEVKDGFSKVVLVPTEKHFLKMLALNPSVAKCEIFLSNYPNSASANNVSIKKEELSFTQAYQKAVTEYDVSDLETYLSSYPSGEYLAKAEKTIEVISWQKARLMDSQGAYQEYIARYPNSDAVKEAAQRLANLNTK